MPSKLDRLKYLFQQYINDMSTPAEVKEFWKLYSALEESDVVKQELWQLWHSAEEKTVEKSWEDALQHIHKQADIWEQQQTSVRIQRRWMWYAAAVVVLISSAAYFLLINKRSVPVSLSVRPHQVKDLAPGGNKATLTLASGTRIILDSAHAGQLASQGNSKVMKVSGGLLTYDQKLMSNGQQQKLSYNTLRTPRGGQYKLILPDGTKVWLNAASSLRFPVSFSGPERKVEVSGEAYFEVVKDQKKPFIVCKGETEIQVLGTHFNVNSYKDEASLKVTLLEGVVKVVQHATHQSRLVRPGQQIQVDRKGRLKLLKQVNVDQVVAWKNNLFWFENADIQSVMRQLSRWYDADVVIKGNIPQHFTGFIPRDIMLSGIFEVLKRTGSIRYKIENGKIIISP